MTHSFITDQNQVEQIEGMTTQFPYCMHRRDLSDLMIPWHWHEELELGYIQKGTSVIVTTNGEYTVHQGDGFFINSNVMDMKRNGVPGKQTIEINHIFHPIFLSGHFKSIFDTKYISPITNNRRIGVHVIRRGTAVSDQLLDTLMRLTECHEQPDMEFRIRSLLSEAWLLLIQELNARPDVSQVTDLGGQARLQTMIVFIHSNYRDKITAAQISETAGISEREAIRIFQKYLSMSPIEYVTSYRLNESLALLRTTSESITEISYQCGFSDSAYFGKQFKTKYGLTPGQYRALGRIK